MVTVEIKASARAKDASIPGVAFGRFELLGCVGEGGMGVVFRARDTTLHREVALKLLNLSGERAEAAVLHEAQCLAKLSHPNVVALYETGKVGAELYLAMEFVQGVDGRSYLRKVQPTWRLALELFHGAGRGLAAAHAAGLEHGDFKPENLLLSAGRRVRVADFGVARALREHSDADEDAATGDDTGNDTGGRGTLDYMAPERQEGRRGDARSDQFSFCVAFWEFLFAILPFPHDEEMRLKWIASGKFRNIMPLRDAPRRLRKALAKGMSLDPADRWPDMQSLLDELTNIEAASKRRRRWMGVAALAMVTSLATAALVYAQGERARTGGFVESLVDVADSYLADAGAVCAGPSAVALARAGEVERALQALDLAERAEHSRASSRLLARASEVVALEFERRLLYEPALDAWHLMGLFARVVGDHDLEQQARDRGYAVANVIYNNSALKQVTVPSSLQTPSWHQ